MLNPKKERISISLCAPLRAKHLKILVVGCGVAEGVIVANANPQSSVVGIDVSPTSINIAKSIKRKYRVRNLVLMNTDIKRVKGIEANNKPTRFDYVCASGVLHHIPDVENALEVIKDLLIPGGIFSGMVYSDKRPAYIRELNKFFRENNYTVSMVREHLDECRNPWFLKYTKEDEELADTWLHPYFVEYSQESLHRLLENAGFIDIKILHDQNDDNKLLFIANNKHAPLTYPYRVPNYGLSN